MNKDKVNQLLNDLKSARYCCHRIIELNEELEVLEHKMLGLSRSFPTLTKEQEKSTKPMPTFHGGYTSPVAMFAEEDRIESEINYYRRRLNECKPIELLSLRDQNMLFDLYFNFKSSWDVAEKYGYSRQGLWKHIKMNLKQLI
jgi:hypothetical protein